MTGRVLEHPRFIAKVSANHGAFLSPDQSMIAFMQWHGWYVSSIAVVPAAAGTPRIVASGIEAHGVRWSSDGSALLYDAYVNASSPTRGRFRVPAMGGTPQLIDNDRLSDQNGDDVVRDPTTGRPVATMVIPAGVDVTDLIGLLPGHQALAGIRRAATRDLRVLSTSDGSVRELAQPGAGVVGEPAWFGGDQLAFVTRTEGQFALHTQRADGSGARSYPLLGISAAEQLRFSPDERYVVFLGRRGGFGTIELLDLTSGKQRALTKVAYDFGDGSSPEGRGIGSIAWSSDSERVLYLVDIWTGAPAVHDVTLAGVSRSLRPLPSFIYGPPPVFFPSTSNPAFVEFAGAGNRYGGGSVSLVPIGDGPPRVVYPGRALGGPLSPDGQMLAIQIPQPNGQPPIQIKLASMDGSQARSLSLPFIATRVLEWHSQGLYVLGREETGGSLNLYTVPVDGNAASVVARLGSAFDEALAVSPDGRFVAATVTRTGKVEFVKLQYDVSGIFFPASKK
jgi:Tol biopolymer transport system component